MEKVRFSRNIVEIERLGRTLKHCRNGSEITVVRYRHTDSNQVSRYIMNNEGRW